MVVVGPWRWGVGWGGWGGKGIKDETEKVVENKKQLINYSPGHLHV